MKALYGKFRSLPTATQIAMIVAAAAIILTAMVLEQTAWLKSAFLFLWGL